MSEKYGVNFKYKLNKWSLARCQNVNFIYRLFDEIPDRVEVIQDKDHSKQLVLMDKVTLDRLLHNQNEDSRVEKFIDRHLKIVEGLLELKEFKNNQ